MCNLAAAALRAVLGLSISLIAASPGLAAPPVEAYATVPDTSSLHLSPDGKHIAAIQPVHGRPQAVVFEFTPAGVQRSVLEIPDAIAREVFWAGDERVIAIYTKNYQHRWDTKLREWVRAFSADAHLQNAAMMASHHVLKVENLNAGTVEDVDMKDPSYVYMALLDSLGVRAPSWNLYRVDLATGRPSLAYDGDDDTSDWVMDGNGNPVARIEDSERTYTEEVQLGGPGNWKTALSYGIKGERDAIVHGLSEDGKSLVIQRVDDAGKSVLFSFDIATGKYGAPLYSNPQYDVDTTISDEWTGRVIGVSYAADKTEYHYFDPTREALQRKLEAVLSGETVQIVSTDIAKDVYIVETSGPRNPPMYQIFKPALMQLSTLTPQYPHLSSADLGEVKPYPYKARDGQEIHAYLTLPPGRDAHNLPAVIFPHGGPEARDTLGFDWWAQFMASRGYAVLQPNFRGSTGYGIAFRDAGRGQWGRTMQNDITDGVKQLIADAIADPKRICIVGASYGGYAALAGATFTPGLYACAISYAGISSIPAMIGYVSKDSGNNDILYAALNAQIGNVFEGEDSLKAVSPGLYADEVRAPVLLLHSDNDVTVPIVQSEIEQNALQKAGKSVQMITLKGDDHYLGLTETRVQLLKAVESFLDAHIGH